MYLTLIVCTYKRPEALKALLGSIKQCLLQPKNILIIDGSPDDLTKDILSGDKFDERVITYYKVPPENRGLTKQRNFGIDHLPTETDIVAFLDDDIIVEPDYFKKLLETYKVHEDAIGVGGLDLKDNPYVKKQEGLLYSKFRYYEQDGWVMKESLRNKARKLFSLITNLQPGLIPEYSHGRSTLPPNGKIYEVEHFTGMSMSFKTEILKSLKFSSYFKGYGLYEDFDFCVRALRFGKLYINTEAKVWHYHEPSGRPDYFKYGKMVVRNGWYVWRVRFPKPSLKARFKWHATTLLLAKIRLLNFITGPQRKDALMDFLGRITAWSGVICHPPM